MKNKSRTSLVLMELIITILLFSISSAVCVKLFVQAHIITNKTEELNHAVEKSQSFAEIFRAANGNIDSLFAIYDDAVTDGKSYMQVYYDSEFIETTEPANASYVCNIKVKIENKLSYITIQFVRLKDQNEIYLLDATKFINTQ